MFVLVENCAQDLLCVAKHYTSLTVYGEGFTFLENPLANKRVDLNIYLPYLQI